MRGITNGINPIDNEPTAGSIRPGTSDGIKTALDNISRYTNTDNNLDIDNTNMVIDLAEDIVIVGDLTVNGTYFTVHAEHVYTEDDYIIMRDGATTGLATGSYSGFQVKKYDGTNDGRLVIDNTGTARVGDVGDEQPLLTREETANMNDGALLKWNASGMKAVDEGTVGTDTKPIKIVNGVATPVTNNLIQNKATVVKTGTGYIIYRIGMIVYVEFNMFPSGTNTITNAPKALGWATSALGGTNTLFASQASIALNGTTINVSPSGEARLGSLIYLTSDP